MFSLLAATYLSPRRGLGVRGFGVSIHLHGSLSQSLFAPLIPLWGFRCWCAVRTLQTVLFKQALRFLWEFYRGHYPFP